MVESIACHLPEYEVHKFYIPAHSPVKIDAMKQLRDWCQSQFPSKAGVFEVQIYTFSKVKIQKVDFSGRFILKHFAF